MAVHSMYVGPVMAEHLSKSLPRGIGDNMHRLPNGMDVLVGTEKVYFTGDKPRRCPIDLGGDVPFVLFPEYPVKEHGGEG